MKKIQTPRHKLEKIFFGVKKVKASDYAPGLKFNSSLSHQIIASTKDGDIVVNQCSENYTLVPNDQIFLPLLQELRVIDPSVDVKVTSYDYSKFYVDFTLPGFNPVGKEKRVGDITPRMRVNNSYDGSVKYSYHFGFYRLVCKNGLSVPVSGKMREQKFLHTPYVADDRALKETLKDLHKFLEDSTDIFAGFSALQKNKYTLEEALDRIEEIATEISDYPKTNQAIAASRLELEAGMKYPINDFLVYNAMNYALYQNPDSEMRTHKRDKVDFKVLDYLIADNS